MKLGGGQSSADGRNALLQSIQKGTKLKKTVTVDKSGPLIQGKVSGGGAAGAAGAGTVGNSNSISRKPASAASLGTSDSNGGQKLGGIFEGLSSMPKLKPVGSRGATAQSATISNKSPSPENTIKSNNRIGGGGNGTGGGGNGGGAVDFADELAAKLTLKKQKNISNSSTNNNNNNNNAIVNSNNSINNQVPVTESNLRTNRGPPPQPPVQLLKNANDSSSYNTLGKSSYSSQKRYGFRSKVCV